MFISMSMRVHVLADREAIGCHGSCDGDCADLFEIEESGIMGSSAVPVCCTRGLDCSQGALCLREHTHTHTDTHTHTHVLQKLRLVVTD